MALERETILIALLEVRRDRIRDRNSYVWKLSLGLWATMLLVSQALIDHSGDEGWLVVLAALLVVGLYVGWVSAFARAHAVDKEHEINLLDELAASADLEPHAGRDWDAVRLRSLRSRQLAAEIGFTILVALVMIVAAWA